MGKSKTAFPRFLSRDVTTKDFEGLWLQNIPETYMVLVETIEVIMAIPMDQQDEPFKFRSCYI
jgi:hypothetical protein